MCFEFIAYCCARTHTIVSFTATSVHFYLMLQWEAHFLISPDCWNRFSPRCSEDVQKVLVNIPSISSSAGTSAAILNFKTTYWGTVSSQVVLFKLSRLRLGREHTSWRLAWWNVETARFAQGIKDRARRHGQPTQLDALANQAWQSPQ